MVIDRERQARDEVVKRHQPPLALLLMDAAGFQWIARAVLCAQVGKRPVAPERAIRIPAGTAPLDCPPHELRVGDHVLAGDHLVLIADLRYRAGATRTIILATGAVCVADRSLRVYRPFAAR
ncbi:hypothetical protein OG906_37805 (plasmid) [Streptomyces sp. NBC_01426]|uniref:hypothetical protein n=1 Tax=unclassified Streptomyces TaxID=2593676 RepID=UPI002E30A78F|nr:hypothetical protein [Streptomyces sp. NBC_01426]